MKGLVLCFWNLQGTIVDSYEVQVFLQQNDVSIVQKKKKDCLYLLTEPGAHLKLELQAANSCHVDLEGCPSATSDPPVPAISIQALSQRKSVWEHHRHGQ